VEVSTALDPAEYAEAASKLKPVLGVLLDIKTQRELIRERVEEPSRQVNQYRDYVEALNRTRGQGLISAERRRELDRLWRENPDERDSLIEGLRELLNPKTANPP
jgi:cytochrome c-type biogenesis protein CcmH/NrfG